MRALMALGAIAAALGLTCVQQIVGHSHRVPLAAPPRKSDPEPETGSVADGPAPRGAAPRGAASGTGASVPTARVPVQRSRAVVPHARTVAPSIGLKTSPAVHVEDGARAAVAVVSFRLPEGTGRHRKPTTGAMSPCASTSGYVGKHRRVQLAGHVSVQHPSWSNAIHGGDRPRYVQRPGLVRNPV
jgi:hypothetical protein